MDQHQTDTDLRAIRQLSPLRKSTTADSIDALVSEQLAHYHIDATTEYGRALSSLVGKLYACGADLDRLWRLTAQTIDSLDRSDRIAYFNAKKFLAFQIAKLLDTLQNPLRRTYQSLDFSLSTQAAKGPYAMFDNVTAIFSATPVIARTATYVYACAEWVAEAFEGREFLEQIYSRLLNPTSLALANYIVELTTNFVLGPGIAVAAREPAVQAVIDAFWDDPDNHMATRVYSLCTELSLYGELFVRFFVNPFSGEVKIAQIDPSLM